MEQYQQAVRDIQEGKAVIFPTDTVYGLGVDATNTDAVRALYDLTDRNYAKGFVILCTSLDMIQSYASIRYQLERQLIQTYMPGDLTLVLDVRTPLGDHVAQADDTIGVRIPNHPLALQLISQVGKPLATKSANRSGLEPPRTMQDIDPYFTDHEITILDGGETPVAIPSTIVRVESEDTFTILRQGRITADMIQSLLGK